MAAATSMIRANQILATAVDRALRPFDLTFARYEVLMLLASPGRGALPMTKIADRLMVHPTGVTKLVDRLEQDGLVRREANPPIGAVSSSASRRRDGGWRSAGAVRSARSVSACSSTTANSSRSSPCSSASAPAPATSEDTSDGTHRQPGALGDRDLALVGDHTGRGDSLLRTASPPDRGGHQEPRRPGHPRVGAGARGHVPRGEPTRGCGAAACRRRPRPRPQHRRGRRCRSGPRRPRNCARDRRARARTRSLLRGMRTCARSSPSGVGRG